MKNVSQGRAKAVANSTAIINARTDLCTNTVPPQDQAWRYSYSPTSLRLAL
jgi:hypothetical protein